MKKIISIALLIINITLVESNEINVFLDVNTCITCEKYVINQLFESSKKIKIDFKIVISGLRKSQYDFIYSKINKEYKSISILIDTNNYLSKKYNITKIPSICYIENENLVYKDSSLIYTNIFKFIEFNSKSSILEENITPIFKPTSQINFEDSLYIIDGFTKKIIVYNIENKQIRSFDYDFLKFKLIKENLNIVKADNLRVLRPIFQTFNNKLYLITKLPFLENVTKKIEDNLSKYRTTIIDMTDYSFDILHNHNKITYYGNYIDRINGGYFFQTYHNIYHHSNHNILKDSTTIFSIFYRDKIDKVLSISKIESYTNSLYTYGFPSRHIKLNNNQIYILNEYFNLFGLINFNFVNNNYEINMFSPQGILKKTMSYLVNVDAFAFLEHKPLNLSENYSIVDIVQNNGLFGIYFYEKDSNSVKYLYFQEYDNEGNLVNEKKINLFDRYDDKLEKVLMIKGNTKNSFLLKYTNTGFYTFTPKF